MQSKIKLIRKLLDEKKVDALILTSDQGRYWLANFKSSFGFLIVTKDLVTFFLDGRYYEKALSKLTDAQIEIKLFKSKETLKDYFYEYSITSGLLEEEYTTLSQLAFFQDLLADVKPISSKQLRIQKNDHEIDSLRKAAEIICDVMEWIKKAIKPGMTEIEVANMITCKILELGGEKNSFDPIVASGINGSFPHHSPTDKAINEGEFVTIDTGCIYNGYCSDLTRTFPIGTPTSDELIKAYDVVLKSNKEGILNAKAGIKGNALDKICRDVIEATPFKDYFVHSTGHGVGIDVHELPNVAPTYLEVIPHNAIVTIEPGIYIPNIGGIRIEDMVLVRDGGNEVLTRHITKDRQW
ncbi:MAG: aminopeptidase P family protein [Mycoplasmoidaceae bacterium]